MIDPNNDEFKEIRKKFLTDLNTLVTVKNDLEIQNATWKFARSAFDFGRLIQLIPDNIWTDQNEEHQFEEQFEEAIRIFSTAVKGMCSIPRAANLYTVKLYLSTFEFLRVDILKLYEKHRSSKKLSEVMNVFERSQFFLHRQIDAWEFEKDLHNPNQWEKPNLNGIPPEHKWWNLELGIKNDENDFEEISFE